MLEPDATLTCTRARPAAWDGGGPSHDPPRPAAAAPDRPARTPHRRHRLRTTGSVTPPWTATLPPAMLLRPSRRRHRPRPTRSAGRTRPPGPSQCRPSQCRPHRADDRRSAGPTAPEGRRASARGSARSGRVGGRVPDGASPNRPPRGSSTASAGTAVARLTRDGGSAHAGPRRRVPSRPRRSAGPGPPGRTAQVWRSPGRGVGCRGLTAGRRTACYVRRTDGAPARRTMAGRPPSRLPAPWRRPPALGRRRHIAGGHRRGERRSVAPTRAEAVHDNDAPQGR
jgi:hypothetical protein